MEKGKRITCISTALVDKSINGKFNADHTLFDFKGVENIDSKGNNSTWIMVVGAVNKKTNKPVPIKQEWLTCPMKAEPGSDIVGFFQTKTKKHTGHLQVNEEVVIDEGKNLGKTNATNVVTQAFFEAYRKYENKKKRANNRVVGNNTVRPFPMLLKKTGVTKSATLTEKDFKDGVVIQPKLDGIRTIAHMLSDQTIEFYSRTGLSFAGLGHIAVEVCELLTKQTLYPPTDINLDGEIYIHNTPLQELSGAIRGEDHHLKSKLEFHVFDCFITNQPNLIQSKRMEILHKLIKKSYKYVKLVKSSIVHSQKELDGIYSSFINKEGYEGAIARRPGGLYKFGIGSQRSSDVTKIKPFQHNEYRITGYKEGRGRDKGAITFELKTPEGEFFWAVPKMTVNKRKAIYTESQTHPKAFEKKYMGKMATIQHAGFSNAGVPITPKFVDLRDYE